MTSVIKSKMRTVQQGDKTVRMQTVVTQTTGVVHANSPLARKLGLPAVPGSQLEFDDLDDDECICINDHMEIDPGCRKSHQKSAYMPVQWPRKRNYLPFTFPRQVDSLPEPKKVSADIVFSVLTQGYKLQRLEEIPDDPALVSIIAHRILTSHNIPNRLAYGYRRLSESRSPHIWLVVGDTIIDPCWSKEILNIDCDEIIRTYPDCYEEGGYVFPDRYSSPPFVATKEDDLLKRKRRIDFFFRKPDKALALSFNSEQCYNYFFAMLRLTPGQTKRQLGIDPAVRYKCWWCDAFPKGSQLMISDLVPHIDLSQEEKKDSPQRRNWEFPQCNRCMVASYCSKSCQKRDWEDNHWFACQTRSSGHLPQAKNYDLGLD